MKNSFLSLLTIVLLSSAAFSQNTKTGIILDENGPNGGEVQVFNDKYTIEMKRNESNISFFINDEQEQAITTENNIKGSVVINYSDKTEKAYLLEPGFDLTNINIDADKPIYMVLIYLTHNSEQILARYYLKEGMLEQDYDKKMMELKKREVEVLD